MYFLEKSLERGLVGRRVEPAPLVLAQAGNVLVPLAYRLALCWYHLSLSVSEAARGCDRERRKPGRSKLEEASRGRKVDRQKRDHEATRRIER